MYIEKHFLGLINTKSDKFVVITIVSCLSVVFTLAVLSIVFLVRRRTLLRQKLAQDVGLIKPGASSGGNSKTKKPLDDEESLIRAEHNQSTSWLSFLPFIRRSDKVQASTNEQTTSSQDYQVNRNKSSQLDHPCQAKFHSLKF